MQDNVEGITAGAWTKSGPVELSRGISLYVPDAKALRSIISDLHRALAQIESGNGLDRSGQEHER